MKTVDAIYDLIISPENLFAAWRRFKSGKEKKADVARFEWELEQNIFQLHRELQAGEYRHGPYKGFWIHDPKRRHIHKATVRDRVVHHALFRYLYWMYDPTFIPTSFSCRLGKGTHKGVAWLERHARKVSKNHTKHCYALKCDVKKFFDSIDHNTLLTILERKIKDKKLMDLLQEIISSFSTERERERANKRAREVCRLAI